MHILITDSGVGGLSVVAYAERFVRTQGYREPVQLTFANAAPENDYGYNSMPTREEKLETFSRFLGNVTDRFQPDMIYVACNTLSVLLPDTPYFATAKIPVKGIVGTGVEVLMRELERNRDATAIIFATPTTIDAGTYPRMLEERGVDPSRIISQACPGLADVISEDREGARTAEEVRKWVRIASDKLAKPDSSVVACLACTHYGYRKDQFSAAFADGGIDAKIVNPNEHAVNDLFDSPENIHSSEVQFITRYRIPDATIDALTYFLSNISPTTVEAMRRFRHDPDLF